VIALEHMETAIRHRREGRLAEAEAAMRRAGAHLDGADDELRAECDIVTGQIRLDQGRLDESLAHIGSAVRRLDGAPNVALRVYATAQQGSALRALGRYQEASRSLRDALDLGERELGEDHPVVAGVHNDFGVLLKAYGDFDGALAHYHRAMPVLRELYGETSDQMATLYHNLGGIEFVRGNLEQAERWARRGVRVRCDVHGPNHIAVVYDLGALAPILIQRGLRAEARELLGSVLARLRRDLGDSHYEVSVVLTNLGALDAAEQRWMDARHHLSDAARIKRSVLGPDSPELVRTLANLSMAAERTGDLALARRSRDEARRIAADSLPPSHPLRDQLEAAAWPGRPDVRRCSASAGRPAAQSTGRKGPQCRLLGHGNTNINHLLRPRAPGRVLERRIGRRDERRQHGHFHVERWRGGRVVHRRSARGGPRGGHRRLQRHRGDQVPGRGRVQGHARRNVPRGGQRVEGVG